MASSPAREVIALIPPEKMIVLGLEREREGGVMGELRELGERAERMREAYGRRERLCLPVEWMPPRPASSLKSLLARPAPEPVAPAPWPEPVRVYVPVVVIEARGDAAAVGPYLNSRPLMVPWHGLRLVRDCPGSDAGMVREIAERWDSL